MALGLSIRHFRHKYLLPALGFHGFLQILSKLPRIRDWATSFSCFLTPASSVPSLGSAEMPVFFKRKSRPVYSAS